MKTVYRVTWDNGANACGTFPDTFATEAEAQAHADYIERENTAEGVWDGDAYCEVISEEIFDGEDDEDEMAILRKAALSNGRP